MRLVEGVTAVMGQMPVLLTLSETANRFCPQIIPGNSPIVIALRTGAVVAMELDVTGPVLTNAPEIGSAAVMVAVNTTAPGCVT